MKTLIKNHNNFKHSFKNLNRFLKSNYWIKNKEVKQMYKIIVITILLMLTAIYFNGMAVSNQLVEKCSVTSVYCD